MFVSSELSHSTPSSDSHLHGPKFQTGKLGSKDDDLDVYYVHNYDKDQHIFRLRIVIFLF